MAKLDLYRSHKIVRAAQIVTVDDVRRVLIVKNLDGTVSERPWGEHMQGVYHPQPGCFYVEYLDNNDPNGKVDFASISPGQKFEDGYTHSPEPVEPQALGEGLAHADGQQVDLPRAPAPAHVEDVPAEVLAVQQNVPPAPVDTSTPPQAPAANT